VQHVAAAEPCDLELLGAERGGDTPVGEHRPLSVRIDDRDDDPARSGNRRPEELDSARSQLTLREQGTLVVPPLRHDAGVRAELGCPRGDVRSLPPGAGTRRGAGIVTAGERLLEPDDNVEEDVSQGADQHAPRMPSLSGSLPAARQSEREARSLCQQ